MNTSVGETSRKGGTLFFFHLAKKGVFKKEKYFVIKVNPILAKRGKRD